MFFFSACTSTDEATFTPPQSIPGATVDAEVGGAKQPDQVFIDLSTGEQSSVNRSAWDLGFYCGSDFRVAINNTTEMFAYRLGKKDRTIVNSSDTVGLGQKLDLFAIFAQLIAPPPQPWVYEAYTWTDDPKGDLNATAISEISENDDDNYVYIINRGRTPENEKRGWFKIRILRQD